MQAKADERHGQVDGEEVEELDYKRIKSQRIAQLKREDQRRTKATNTTRAKCFSMDMKTVGLDPWKIKCMTDTLHLRHPVETIPPIHTLGQTWTKQDNPEVTDQTRHIPKLEHDYDSMALDGDDVSASGEKENNRQLVLTGNPRVDGLRLFEEYKRYYPKADRHLYWDRITKEWDVEALKEDIYIEKNRGRFPMFKESENERRKEMMKIEYRKNGELILPKYKNWDEVAIHHTNQDVAVHYAGERGLENLNEMYRNQSNHGIQRRLAQLNKEMARIGHLHSTKGIYTMMKLSKADVKRHQEQRKKNLKKGKGPAGKHLSDDDIFDTLDWQPTTCNEGAVFYSEQLMLEHREKYENDGKDPKNPQLVTVKHIKDLGFED
mmetsp:Transcript_8281/g.15359  ORF Transcript_8281/g.15359 Transcript_8281/m.15359 type:complete len:378 (+) Transcript_8281:107-1240(+)